MAELAHTFKFAGEFLLCYFFLGESIDFYFWLRCIFSDLVLVLEERVQSFLFFFV